MKVYLEKKKAEERPGGQWKAGAGLMGKSEKAALSRDI